MSEVRGVGAKRLSESRTFASEHIEDLLTLGFTQRPGGRWTGLLVPGS